MSEAGELRQPTRNIHAGGLHRTLRARCHLVAHERAARAPIRGVRGAEMNWNGEV